MWVVYFPVSFYYIFLSIKARSPFFFSASNPSIETGGMFFESKWSIFQLMPKAYYPNTILIEREEGIDTIRKKMQSAALHFPLIAKPDRGERGWCVKKIVSEEELIGYRNRNGISFLLQEYIDQPVELSIFYFRKPGLEKGTVTSVTLKKLLSVTGDGYSTIEKLIQKNDRAFLQMERLKKEPFIDLAEVVEKGEEKLLVPYGNHVLGTMFINYNHIIDEVLIDVIDGISKQIPDFYFGRFDLRCGSIEELKKGKNISILELNGAGAEPAHIYDPSFSFFQAQFVLADHYRMMFEAAMENKKKAVSFMTFRDFMQNKKLEKEYKQSVVL